MSDSTQERLLQVMDSKDHFAWPYLTKPGLTKAQLLVHFRHEYQTYVRDFPVLLARVLGLGPPDDVRKALAENIYEEQTGGLSVGVSHPELFLDMMEGLGFQRADLESGPLEPEALRYRQFLDEKSAQAPWQLGASVLTVFVEGSRFERDEMEGRRHVVPVDQAVAEHPMVKHYGCPKDRMRLLRAHRAIEGEHRKDAWSLITNHVGREHSEAVVEAVTSALKLWLAYRDGVARAMGLD